MSFSEYKEAASSNFREGYLAGLKRIITLLNNEVEQRHRTCHEYRTFNSSDAGFLLALKAGVDTMDSSLEFPPEQK